MDTDGTVGYQFALQGLANQWVTNAAAAQGQKLTPQELNTRVAAIMQVPVEFLEPNRDLGRISATSNLIAEGREIELNYNPTSYWSVKLNVAEQKATQINIGGAVPQYLAERLKVWQSIIDPTTGQPWFTTRLGVQVPANVVADNSAKLDLELANEGTSNPLPGRLQHPTEPRRFTLADQRLATTRRRSLAAARTIPSSPGTAFPAGCECGRTSITPLRKSITWPRIR